MLGEPGLHAHHFAFAKARHVRHAARELAGRGHDGEGAVTELVEHRRQRRACDDGARARSSDSRRILTWVAEMAT